MSIDFPYHLDGRGRTAECDPADDDRDHIRDLIEQLLFTAPGERVMRPDFGSGLMQLVFEPGGPEVAATTQYLVQGALENYLGGVITVDKLTVEAVDSTLYVTLSYLVLATRTTEVASFQVPGGAA